MGRECDRRVRRVSVLRVRHVWGVCGWQWRGGWGERGTQKPYNLNIITYSLNPIT